MSAPSSSYEDFCDSCVHEFVNKNRAWTKRFAMATWPRWDYDDTDHLLVFSDDSGPQVLCTYLNVGTLSNKTGSWLWAWANESLSASERERATPVREYGKARQIAELTERHFKAQTQDAWTLTAVAGHLLGAQALYRPVAGHLEIYMLVMSTRRIEA